MNAGQHLLSAVVEQVAGADTLSWELHPQQPHSSTADTVNIDLSIPSLTPKQMSDIEVQCNAHIRAARSIRQLVLDGSSKGQAERQAVIEKGNLRGKLPPADVIQVTNTLCNTGCLQIQLFSYLLCCSIYQNSTSNMAFDFLHGSGQHIIIQPLEALRTL